MKKIFNKNLLSNIATKLEIAFSVLINKDSGYFISLISKLLIFSLVILLIAIPLKIIIGLGSTLIILIMPEKMSMILVYILNVFVNAMYMFVIICIFIALFKNKK